MCIIHIINSPFQKYIYEIRSAVVRWETWISHKFSFVFSTSALILIFICFWYIMWKMKNVVENSFSHKHNGKTIFHGTTIWDIYNVMWQESRGFLYERELSSWNEILHYSLNTSLNSYYDCYKCATYECLRMNLGSMFFVYD